MPDKAEKNGFVPAVKFIADDRITRSQQMGAYLMKSPRFGKAPNKGNVMGCKDFPESCQSLLRSTRSSLLFFAHNRFTITSQRQIDNHFLIGKISVHQGQVFF